MSDPDTTETLPLDDTGDTRLPIVEVLTGRGFITGKSGSGKSNTASVVVEELLDQGFPVLIVDTDGEYWGLKEEYEILHVGADEECDLQVGPEHASKLASLALEENVPIILDVSGYLDTSQADALVRETAAELFKTEKKLNKPFLLLVEEVHEYIPEGGGLDDTGEMLVRIGKRGRKRGLGLVGMSQRPADVKKDFITQCDWLMWHRLTWQNDTQVVRTVVDTETSEAVQDLGDGEGFLMADFLDADLQRVQVRRKHTYDAGATPDLEATERPDLKSVSGDLVGELEEISEREDRRQDRISELEAQVEDLQAEKAELEEELENARDMREMASQFANALQSGGNGDAAGEKVDELIEERNQLRSKLEDRDAELETLETEVEDLQRELAQRPEIDERAAEAVEVLAGEFGVADGDNEALQRKLQTARERNDDLEDRVDTLQERLENADGGVSVPTDYHEFVQDDTVQDVIEEAKRESSASPKYVKGVVATVLEEGGPVDYQTIADRLGVSTTSDISKAASTLQTMGVLERVEQSPAVVDFDLQGVAEIKARQRRREQTEAVMENL